MIFDDIKLHYPNIWIQDTDPSRIIDIITTTVSSKEYYALQFVHGFSQLINETWKPVLVQNPKYPDMSPDQWITTSDPGLAIHHLTQLHQTAPAMRSLFMEFIGDPTMALGSLGPHLNYFKSTYRQAFWSNNILDIPFQLICLSTVACPEDMASYFRVQDELYPSLDELMFIVDHINSACDHQVLGVDAVADIAKAGLGLNESDFIKIALDSILQRRTIDASYVYTTKTANIKKHGILEIIKPTISFADIGGLDTIKDIIHRTSVLRANPEQTVAYGITPIRRMLMIGLPGTGKSAICQATAKELGLDLARTGISQVMNSYIGQSEANMRAVFKQIKALTPLCVWIDEFGRDMSGGSSSSHVDGGTTDRVHGEFLTGLQELPEDAFLLCAANQLDALRPEMLRADRFDKIMFVGLPAHDERKHIFKIHLDKIETTHSYDYDALAMASQYMTGAEIVSVIRETKFYVASDTFRPIATDDILNRIPQNKNTIWLKHTDMVKSMYTYAIEQWEWASTQQHAEASMVLGRSVPRQNARVMMS